MNVTTATPVEIDTKLQSLYNDLARAVNRQAAALIQIHRAVGDDTSYRKRTHDLTHEQAIAKAEAQAAGVDFLGAARKGLDALVKAQDGMKQVTDQIDPLEAEYRRRPWNRAWLVTSSAGHVHRNQDCSTCNRRTSYALMFMFSGQTEAQIVEAAGERACTICYPSAPVDVLSRPTRMFTDDEIDAQAARDKRAEEKRVREAKKLEKAITADGSPLKVGDQSFKTEVAARNWLVDHIGGSKAWGYRLDPEAVEIVTAALAAKHGVTIADEVATIEAKVTAWLKRNARG